MEDHLIVDTPERVQISYELAGIVSRGLACAVDFTLQALFVLLVIWVLLWVNVWVSLPDLTGTIMALVMAAAGALLTIVYYIVSEMTMNGQSPGKRMAGLRVVRDDGTPLTFSDSAIRNIVRLVDMLPLFYSIGLLAVFFHRQSKRLGDMAAGTVVIKERLYEAPAAPIEPADPVTVRPDSPLETRLRPLVRLLGETDCNAVQRFLERRDELAPEVRAQMAERLTGPLLARLPGLTRTDLPGAEAFLEAVIRLRGTRLL